MTEQRGDDTNGAGPTAMNAAPPDGTTPDQPGGGTSFGLLVGIATLLVWGTLMLVFGRWLLEAHAATLDWPSNLGAGFLFVGALVPALLARHGCRRRGWAPALATILAASVVAVVLCANLVAAAVILWAVHPAAAGGVGGLLASALAGLLLTVPVSFGAIVLLHRWQASDVPWKERFRNEHFRKPTLLGLGLGLAGFFAARLTGTLLESWLHEAFPAAQALHTDTVTPGIAIVLICVLTGPSDRRSALRSLLAAVVVFEAAAAGGVTEAVLMLTLRSDSLWLATAESWLVAPVFLGAALLAGRRENAAEGRPGNGRGVGTDEGAPA